MAAGLTVGDFSRATHLSVKTLRHYHQVGLLEPVTVSPDTGYRYYSAEQIPTAQVIRRLRGPLREYYLRGAGDTPEEAEWRTEIGWPIFRADSRRA
jgi:MerR HTH family regulatory protein